MHLVSSGFSVINLIRIMNIQFFILYNVLNYSEQTSEFLIYLNLIENTRLFGVRIIYLKFIY